MATYVVLTPDQIALEQAADALLGTLPRDSDRPVYSEIQLRRRGRRLVSVETLLEVAGPPAQSMRDEIRFLASVSALQADLRRCLALWIDGWSQQEIAKICGVSQQRVSQRLRRALRICYDAAPLSFRRFSRHTTYQPPRRACKSTILRQCARCGESYPLSLGYGPYCSSACREARGRKANSA